MQFVGIPFSFNFPNWIDDSFFHSRSPFGVGILMLASYFERKEAFAEYNKRKIRKFRSIYVEPFIPEKDVYFVIFLPQWINL